MPVATPSRILFCAALSLALAGCSPDYQPTLPGDRNDGEAGPSGQEATAIFAGGCFWCTESDFEKVPGVVAAVSGYTGGTLAKPTYEQVSAGGTGHYEAVRVTYDPVRVTYPELVAYYFRTVDPTDAGGQFCDRGASYRTAIFVADEDERGIAEREKEEVMRELRRPVATMVLPVTRFYPAEDYHQDYYRKNSLKYRFYRTRCGRDARLREVWGRR